MENKIQSLPCEIVRDLLPLYHDKVVSEMTEHAVAKHLADCAPCAKEYAGLCRELPEEPAPLEEPRIKFRKWEKNMKKKLTWQTALITLTCFLLFLRIGYLLITQPIIPIAEKDLPLDQIYLIEKENGSYALYFRYPLPKANRGQRAFPSLQVKDGVAVFHTDHKLSLYETLFPPKGYKIGSCVNVIQVDAQCEPDTIREIWYDGKLVWNKEESDSYVIPEYIYDCVTYFDFDPTDRVRGYGPERNSIDITYDTCRVLTFSWQGDILQERYLDVVAETRYFNGYVVAMDENRLLVCPDITSDLSQNIGTVSVSLNTLQNTSAEALQQLENGSKVRIRYHATVDPEEKAISDADLLVLGWSFDEL